MASSDLSSTSTVSAATSNDITHLLIDMPRGLYSKRLDPKRNGTFSADLDIFISSVVRPTIGRVINLQDSRRSEMLSAIKVETQKHTREKLAIQSPTSCAEIVCHLES